MIDINKIKETKVYKSLNHIQKVMFLKKINIKRIELGITMSKLRSFDFWVQTTKPNSKTESVVRELLE
jgi:hypothetical protein